jgi:hypothetical protein
VWQAVSWQQRRGCQQPMLRHCCLQHVRSSCSCLASWALNCLTAQHRQAFLLGVSSAAKKIAVLQGPVQQHACRTMPKLDPMVHAAACLFLSCNSNGTARLCPGCCKQVASAGVTAHQAACYTFLRSTRWPNLCFEFVICLCLRTACTGILTAAVHVQRYKATVTRALSRATVERLTCRLLR